ncbi:MAG: ABC transporter ATP-binding protein [Candidatus Competibacteraceae bacterium]|jgi:iron(III) transport system ATP-binding protein|nr:ABC transporter ATP-binding protein [Candidatus Competibacteraceae bacterium]
MTAALAFVDIAHRFGELQALQQVSFQIAAGDILCLLGPSGCGKTTALRIAAGLERPHHGLVQINGRTVSGNDGFVVPEARGVGLLFQDYALFPHLTVERNVLFGLKGLPAAEQRSRTRYWLQRVGLWDRQKAYPHMLSGGEQQRVALARALAPQPAVLLLDEPFSNLDSQLRYQVREDVLRTIKDMDTGTAALMVTHDPEEALYMGDQIALMDKGRIIQTGTANDLYCQPLNPLVATFFGSVNRFSSDVQAGHVATPMGALPAGHLTDGTEVDVLVRTEGIGLAAQEGNDPAPNAIISTIRRLGQISRIDLQTLPETGFDCSLTVHVLGPTAYQVGDHVKLILDSNLAFVFPVQVSGDSQSD